MIIPCHSFKSHFERKTSTISYDFAWRPGWTCQQASETVSSPWIPWQLDTSSTSLSRIATNLASTSGHASSTNAYTTGGLWALNRFRNLWLNCLNVAIDHTLLYTELAGHKFSNRCSNSLAIQAMKSCRWFTYQKSAWQYGRLVLVSKFQTLSISVFPKVKLCPWLSWHQSYQLQAKSAAEAGNGRSRWIMLGYSWPGWPSWDRIGREDMIYIYI